VATGIGKVMIPYDNIATFRILYLDLHLGQNICNEMSSYGNSLSTYKSTQAYSTKDQDGQIP
jgi:hypothetical protein